jgi:23S rRNA pseudouridine1911/1915/1917 synthase
VQEGAGIKRLKPTEGKVEIVYQDEDLLAVNKPFGLKVHPGTSRDTDSLLNVLYYQLGDKVTNYGLSLINRIDKDTSDCPCSSWPKRCLALCHAVRAR